MSMKNIKEVIQINGNMARHGILFLSFSLLLFAVKEISGTHETRILPFIPPPPVSFSIILRIILALISLIFIGVIFLLWYKYRRTDFFKGRFKVVAYSITFFSILPFFIFSIWIAPPLPVFFYPYLGYAFLGISAIFMIAVFSKGLAGILVRVLKGHFQIYYWIIFILVFVIGLGKGLGNLEIGNITRTVVDIFGVVWLLVLLLIVFKVASLEGKR